MDINLFFARIRAAFTTVGPSARLISLREELLLHDFGFLCSFRETMAMFTRDRFQMVPIQNSCRIGLLFTRDLLTVPSIRCRYDQVRKLDLQKSRSSFWNRSGPKRIRHRVNTRTGSFWWISHRINTWTGSFWYFGAILKATTCILRMLNW